MASPPVVDLLQNAGSLLGPDSKVYTVSWVPGFLERSPCLPSISQSEGQVKQPFVIWASISDPEQAHIDALAPYGRAVIQDSTEQEPDTIFYANARPRDGSQNNDISGGFVCAVELYATKQAALTHMGRQSVRDLVAAGHGQGSKFQIKLCNMVHGFMAKS